jgi:hypothetical protein
MGGLAQEGVIAHAELSGDRTESNCVGFIQHGDSPAAVAVDPAHVTKALPGYLHQVAQKILFRFG